MNKKCKDCGEIKNIKYFYGVQGECSECTKKRVKKRYYIPEIHERIVEYDKQRAKTSKRKLLAAKTYQNRKITQPIQWKARYLLNMNVQLKKIIRKPCEVCGELKTEGHHENYHKPLVVKWLCKKHHILIHKKPF